MFGQVRIASHHHQLQQSNRQIGEVPTHDVSYGMVRYGQPIHGISNPSEPKAKIKLITSSPCLWLRFPTETG